MDDHDFSLDVIAHDLDYGSMRGGLIMLPGGFPVFLWAAEALEQGRPYVGPKKVRPPKEKGETLSG